MNDFFLFIRMFYRVREGDEERMGHLALQVQLVLLDSRYHCYIYSVYQYIYSVV